MAYLDQDDNNLVVLLSGASSAGCSLNESPKKNWVEKSGGLPNYICQIAKGIMKSGKPRSSAIAIAVSRVKQWAADPKTEAKTRAKSVAAAAQWEALKGKNKAKKLVKASNLDDEQYIMLTETGPFNTDIVRSAWNAIQQEKRAAYWAQQRALNGDSPYDGEGINVMPSPPYGYIRELWTDHLICSWDDPEGEYFTNVPYTIDDGDVSFGEPTRVEIQYVPVTGDADDDDDDLSDYEYGLLGDVLTLSASQTALERISSLAAKL